MSFISVFDVLGPTMVGPSSSHTAGAVKIALMARKLMHGEITDAQFTLYGSFAKTYRGHGTDRALVGGLLGFFTDDTRIRESFRYAEERGMNYTFQTNLEEEDIHPNTVDIRMTDETGYTVTVRGESLGGGKARLSQLNGTPVDITGEYCSLIVEQMDRPGVLASIADELNDTGINIAFLRLFRQQKGGVAYTIVDTDEEIPEEIVQKIRSNENILDAVEIKV